MIDEVGCVTVESIDPQFHRISTGFGGRCDIALRLLLVLNENGNAQQRHDLTGIPSFRI